MHAVAKVKQIGDRFRHWPALVAAGLAALSMSTAALAQQSKVNVVAAENFYGDVVQQLGGAHVDVTSILSNPDEDPHLFEASPMAARELHRADVVVYNGADYDPWMNKLLAASTSPDRATIVVAASLAGTERATIRISGTTRARCSARARAFDRRWMRPIPRTRPGYRRGAGAVLRLV